MISTHPINFNQHDHASCINHAMEAARDICLNRGVRLTELRAKILELIWQSHRPIGAYTILELISNVSAKRVAPPTIYRALEFLLEQGFIHQIKSLNAFLGCPAPANPHHHQSYFLICKKCGNTLELQDAQLSKQIKELAVKVGFVVKTESLEVTGLCSSCDNEHEVS